jgi:hypothetical protein
METPSEVELVDSIENGAKTALQTLPISAGFLNRLITI